MSGLFQDIITVYNKYTKNSNWTGGPPPTNTVAYSKTIIRNVMWKDRVHYSAENGKSFINKTISVTIPLDKMRTDKKYIKPKDFTPENWTFNIGDIIVFGECDKEITSSYTITNLRNDFKSMEISVISDSTDQSILPCWKLEGV